MAVYIHALLTSTFYGGESIDSRPIRSVPWEVGPVPIGGPVGLRVGLNDLEKRNIFSLLGIEPEIPLSLLESIKFLIDSSVI